MPTSRDTLVLMYMIAPLKIMAPYVERLSGGCPHEKWLLSMHAHAPLLAAYRGAWKNRPVR
jgi:hypothetical protein